MIGTDNTAVIIPVYNEGNVIKGVVDNVLSAFKHVVCVDDGSKDNSVNEIRKTKALLVRHPINMGQGAALQTGLDFALQMPHVKYFITFDADGQHGIDDAIAMLKTLKKTKVDIVVGSRFLGSAVDMSSVKKVLLKLAVGFTNIYSRVSLTDTHNGLRVFNRAFAEKLDITMPGMAHASEIIDKIGRGGWQYLEVPVTIHYTDYSKAKGQSMLNSVNILMDIFIHKATKR